MSKLIKPLSLNISLFDANNEKLFHFLDQLNTDIVCLQEVTRKVDDFAFDSFISKQVIDKATKQLNHSYYAPNWALKDFRQNNFHGKKLFSHEFGGVIEYGNYVKSKFEIIRGKSIFVQQHFSYVTDWEWIENHPGEEPRMVQVVDMIIDGNQKLRILNYHGIWSKDKRGTLRTELACQRLVQLASEVSFPTIMCGDFNLFPETKSIRILKENFRSLVDEYHIQYTRPKSNELSGVKHNVVDYIFVSKEIEVQKFEVIDSDVSDHFPLIMEFEVK